MTVQSAIEDKLKQALNPTFLVIENESHKHSRPPGTESHFRVIVVSDFFKGMSRVQRQQKVFSVLDAEMKNSVHALSQFAFTPDEWKIQKDNFEIQSPDCMHKN